MKQMYKTDKCPICNETTVIGDEFCNNCSWELIDIPKESNDALLNYFNSKIKKHKQLFEKQITDSNTITQINEENYKLEENVSKLEDANQKITVTNQYLNNEVSKKKEIENQLNTYIERYGDSFEISSNSNKKRIVIYWEIENNIIKLSSSEIECLDDTFSKIAVLFNKNSNPQIGNFDFSVIGEIKKNTVIMNLSGFPKGNYLVKPISISNKKINVTFISEEKSKNASNYNINNIKIHI